MPNLKVLIADDHKIVRDGLRSLIETNIADVTIVAECSNGREALREARRLNPDIVLMDVSMPELNGLEAVRKLTASLPECRTIVLSMHSSHEVIGRMLRAGAMGYLHKDAAFDELEKAIKVVATGEVYLGSGIAAEVVKELQRLPARDDEAGPELLSAREREVLQLVAEGRRTREIADTLNISTKTVESHRGQLFKKLNIDSIAGLTHYAIRNGIIELKK